MAAQDILRLAQERAKAAMANANAGGDETSVDPEVLQKREERKAAREQRNLRIVELYNAGEGKSVTEIMQETDVSRVTVINVLNEAGVYKARRRHTEEEAQAVTAMLKADETDPEKIANACGVEVQYVRNIARKIGADLQGQRGRLDPAKIPEVVERALDLEEFAGVNIMTIAQYIYRLKKDLEKAENGTAENTTEDEVTEDTSEDTDETPKRGRTRTSEPAA